jgi:hypothetical protein
MRPQQFGPLVLLGGTVALAGSGAAMFGGLDASGTGIAATPFVDRWATSGMAPPASSYLKLPRHDVALAPASVAEAAAAEPGSPEPHLAPAAPTAANAATTAADAATADPEPRETTFVLASVSATHAPSVEDTVPDADATPPGETRPRLVSLFRPQPAADDLKPAPQRVEIPHECPVLEICIDEYLWALYERTPKVDTNKVVERYKATVKRKGKTRTVTKTRIKYVLGDFTWKDPIAAKRVGMSLKDYVIGGMDRSFKLKLFRALYAMDQAGLMPGITSAFRDDYRQAIAVGQKAASDSSFHGGSRRGGYGHGLAADLVSVRGDTRMQRWVSTVELWRWIDANEKDLEIGRPYRDRDPPHVGPKDGREFIAKRGGTKVQKAGLATKKAQAAKSETKKPQVGARNGPGATIGAKPAKSSKVSSLQNRASVQR